MTKHFSGAALLTVTTALIGLEASAACADGLGYTAVDLGTIVPGKVTAFAYDINNRGQVAGQSVGTITGSEVGFVTGVQGTGVRVVGTFATGINDIGASTGMQCDEHFVSCRGFVMGPRGHHAVHDRPRGVVNEWMANGLSATGQAAGWVQMADGYVHAFRTGPGGANPRDLGTLTGLNSEATAINEIGQVCGSYWNEDSESERVFITDTQGVMRDPGFQGDCSGINIRGQLVGSVGREGTAVGVAFITGPDGHNMRMFDKTEGSRGSRLIAINRHGQAVGVEFVYGDEDTRAVVTDQGGEHLYYLDDLVEPPLGVDLSEADAINDQGEIAAHGWDGHIYLLKPIR